VRCNVWDWNVSPTGHKVYVGFIGFWLMYVKTNAGNDVERDRWIERAGCVSEFVGDHYAGEGDESSKSNPRQNEIIEPQFEDDNGPEVCLRVASERRIAGIEKKSSK
jgi:hypothetical protein